MHMYMPGTCRVPYMHTSQISHLLLHPSLWLLVPAMDWATLFCHCFLCNLLLRGALISNIFGKWLKDPPACTTMEEPVSIPPCNEISITILEPLSLPVNWCKWKGVAAVGITELIHPNLSLLYSLLYRIAGNFRGRKLLQIGRKWTFHRETFRGIQTNLWVGVLRLWFREVKFHGWLSNHEICESFLPLKFPAMCTVFIAWGQRAERMSRKEGQLVGPVGVGVSFMLWLCH